MPITGTHMMLYSPEAEKLRELLVDILPGGHVDAGGGWLIFALPPAELGVHPGEGTQHELSFHCDDIDATIAELTAKGVEFSGEIMRQDWGAATMMTLPGGVRVQLYQPAHASPQ